MPEVDLTRLYLQHEEFKAVQEIHGAYSELPVELVVEAASRVVDAHCGRRFWLDPEPTTRTFTPWEREWVGYGTSSLVEIDDVVTVSAIDSSVLAGDDFPTPWAAGTYALEPQNASAFEWPYTRIIAPVQSGGLAFPCWTGAVRVSGVFGWPQVPPQVRLATAILAGRYLRRARDAPFGVIGFGGDEGSVRLSKTDPDVATLLGPLVR